MPISPDTKLRLVADFESAGEFMRWLGERHDSEFLALDTETTGLNPFVDRVRLVQFGDKNTGWAIPLEHGWHALIQEALDRWSGSWVLHNAVFDERLLQVSGVRTPARHRIRDTKLMAAVLEPENSFALKSLASRLVDRHAAGAQKRLDQVMSEQKWTWATVPIQRRGPASAYWAYGALDTVLTAHLHDVLWPRVQAECPSAYDLEAAVAWVTSDMGWRGVYCDRELTRTKRDEFRRYVDEAAAWSRANFGVDPGSSTQVTERMISDGVELTERTPGGAWRLDREVLESLVSRGAHPLAELVLKRRRAEKVAGSFLGSFLELSERDGMLHPSINSVGGSNKSSGESGGDMGVRTGRMSLNGPNLSALPRVGDGNEFADVVRHCILPHPDELFITSDLDQIEIRLLAHFTESDGMKEALRIADAGGADFFTALARQMYEDAMIIKKDPRRNVVKQATYATSYGSGVSKFATTSGLAVPAAQAFMNKFHGTYPDLRRYMKQLEGQLRENGYVPSPITGRRHTPDAGFSYKILNYMIQGTAAEIFKRQLLELDAAGLGPYLVLPVHDEATLSVPKTLVPEAARIVHGVMNDHRTLTVPITAGVATGVNWGVKEEYRLD